MTSRSYNGEVVWIIGASSGIGNALARELVSRGAKVALSARRKDELEQLRSALGDAHRVFPLDVADAAQTKHVAEDVRAAFGRIDRAVFLAAIYAPMPLDQLDMPSTKQMIEVNLLGAFHAVHALLPIMKAQQHPGQIALCGSVAGYTGLPQGQPYSSTKAGVMNLAESLQAECAGSHIDIKLISPGFVRTAMTAKNDFSMPMIISPEEAAHAIADGLICSGFEIHFPKRFTFLVKLLRILPYWLALKITRRAVPKRAKHS